jgi:hypothetical protein
MSEVKVGDRVRVIIEGEVNHVTQDGFLDVAGVYYSSELGGYGVVSIEVIPAPFVLPTKMWAQVWDKGTGTVMDVGTLWTRRHLDGDRIEGLPEGMNDEWFSDDYLELSSEHLLELPGLRVISEGVDDE